MECTLFRAAKAGLVDGGSLFSLAGNFNDHPGFLAPFPLGCAADGTVSVMGFIRLDTQCGDLAVEPLSRSFHLGSGSCRRSLICFFLPIFPPLAHLLDHNKKGWHEKYGQERGRDHATEHGCTQRDPT